jgi:hypothetical protein
MMLHLSYATLWSLNRNLLITPSATGVLHLKLHADISQDPSRALAQVALAGQLPGTTQESRTFIL